jgi:hypothetical protein
MNTSASGASRVWIGRIVTRVVADAEASRDRFAGVRWIGIDEVSYK